MQDISERWGNANDMFGSCFLKLFSVLKNKENTFGSLFFVQKNTKKNIENANFREHEQFLENIKIMFSVFSKTILKNNF